MIEGAHGFWERVEAILVINMDHRTDRWEALMKILREVGVEHKVVRIQGIRGTDLGGYKKRPWFSHRTPECVARMKAGMAGCTLSHRRAIEHARSAGLEHFLVLEDDARFDNLLLGREGEMIGEVIAKPDEWDLFYLGFYQRLNLYHTICHERIGDREFQIRRMRGPLLTHAFLVNSSAYDLLLDQLPTEANVWEWMAYWGSIDSWIYNHFGRSRKVKVWGTMPRLVTQAADFSDICGRIQSTEESRGEHRRSTEIEKDEQAFERALDLGAGERIYHTLKRGGRQWRARCFGFTKS